jgi:hypothetical protein
MGASRAPATARLGQELGPALVTHERLGAPPWQPSPASAALATSLRPEEDRARRRDLAARARVEPAHPALPRGGQGAARRPEVQLARGHLGGPFRRDQQRAGYTNVATTIGRQQRRLLRGALHRPRTRTGRTSGSWRSTATPDRRPRRRFDGGGDLDNDELYIIGVAQPEGDTSRPSRSSNPTKQTNYMQIQREPFDITGTAMSSRTR